MSIDDPLITNFIVRQGVWAQASIKTVPCVVCVCVRVLISNLPCRVICLGIPAENQTMNINIYRK